MLSLPELPDVDTRLGLSRAGGCLPLYLCFLRRFPEDDSLSALLTALDRGDARAAFAAAHSLKGLSAQLGIVPVSESAARICELLRPLDPGALPRAREEAARLADLHARVCRELASVQSPSAV